MLCLHVNDPLSVEDQRRAGYTTAQMSDPRLALCRVLSLTDRAAGSCARGQRDQTLRLLEALGHPRPDQAPGSWWVPVSSALHLELRTECFVHSRMQSTINPLVLGVRGGRGSWAFCLTLSHPLHLPPFPPLRDPKESCQG